MESTRPKQNRVAAYRVVMMLASHGTSPLISKAALSFPPLKRLIGEKADTRRDGTRRG